jgi:hypothetical protein
MAIVESAQLGRNQGLEAGSLTSERASWNNPLNPGIVVKKHQVAAFQVADKLLPRSSRLACPIVQVQAFLAKVNTQRSEIMLAAVADHSKQQQPLLAAMDLLKASLQLFLLRFLLCTDRMLLVEAASNRSPGAEANQEQTDRKPHPFSQTKYA